MSRQRRINLLVGVSSLVILLRCPVFCTTSLAQGAFFSMPLPASPGNSSQTVPFSENRWRYQQVHSASDFSTISTNGLFITHLVFLDEETAPNRQIEISNFQAHLSLSTAAPDSLSLVFQENVGGNRQLVYDGSLVYSGPTGFQLSQPYYYNPGEGDLLLELTNLSGSQPDNRTQLFDAHEVVGDSVSSVYGLVGAHSGIRTTRGLVIGFQGFTVPEPSVTSVVVAALLLIVLNRKRGKNVAT